MNRFSWKNFGKEIVAWIVVLVPIVLALFVFVYLPSRRSSPSPVPNSSGNPQIDSSLSVVPKSKGDSDLVVEHHYKATIDGEVVNIPIKTVASPVVVDDSSSPSLSGDNSGVSGASSYTAHYKQELDLTPLLSDYEHKTNWEVGVGIGSHSGDVYYPMSIQRNLSNDRAVEGVVHISSGGKVDGGEVLYKHRF